MKKLSRRMFLGTAAAAPLASQIQEIKLATPPTNYSGVVAQEASLNYTNMAVENAKYLAAKKEYLEKIARGEFTPAQERRMTGYPIDNIDNNVQSLRSVSPSIKRIITFDKYIKKQKSRYITNALNQLKTLFNSPSYPGIEKDLMRQLPEDEDY